MKYAQLIRDFLSALFGSKLVVQLRLDLDEARRERDYFRGRIERLELAAQMDRDRLRPLPVVREKRDMSPLGGRKTWPQIQREHKQKVADALKAEEEQKQRDKAAN